MKVYNKYYRHLRSNVFQDIEIAEFMEIWLKYKRLGMQYRLLQICTFLEKLDIPVINVFLLKFLSMLVDFIRWELYDFLIFLINGRAFNLYGVTCYCGRQGSGKTIGVVRELEKIKEKYPEAIICTNINYLNQDLPLVSWLQLLELRNGQKGVVFVIDEVQNQGLDWTKFPETLMAVITQQRKQKIKIYLTAQVYKTVVIQIRRQCFDVVECKTFFGRWTKHKAYDAEEYNNVIDNPTPEKKMRMPKKWKDSFIQDNVIRGLYDTNQVVTKMKDFEALCTGDFSQKIKKGRYLTSLSIKKNGVIKRYNVRGV